MTVAIAVENLSKKYRINHEQTTKSSWWDTLRHKAKSPLRNLKHGAALGSVEDFWALRDIDFEVQQGEAQGIIGSNGAGKSTLLKILSRITAPTGGRTVLRGRAASLLEVGTGFHPELTGRDNVYLNGSILGLSRAETCRKFDEIVAFSGIERFIDTPIKRYSSGMKVRLAFAVAAHLDLEIMIIDEVLAVGDIDFQRKCLGKMEDAAGCGRTVLFVSHNMNAITKLCERAILLDQGRIVMQGDVSSVTHEYIRRHAVGLESASLDTWPVHRHGGPPVIEEIYINDVSLPGEVILNPGDHIEMAVAVDGSGVDLRNFALAWHISSEDGVRLMSFNTLFTQSEPIHLNGRATFKCQVPSCPLIPGDYLIDVNCGSRGGFAEAFDRVGAFRVTAKSDFWNGVHAPIYKRNGYLYVDQNWTVKQD